jgi:hypothetical protein
MADDALYPPPGSARSTISPIRRSLLVIGSNLPNSIRFERIRQAICGVKSRWLWPSDFINIAEYAVPSYHPNSEVAC